MRIGIDIRSLQNDSRNRGIGTYTRCLIEKLLFVDRRNEYVFFAFKDMALPSFLKDGVFKHVRIRKVTYRRRLFVSLWGQVVIPPAIAHEGLDLFHSTEFILPVISPARKVITVHDFINSDYKIYRRRSGLIRIPYFYLKNGTLKFADRIIAVSEYTKKKIAELAKIKEERIEVIYEAADDIFRPIADNGSFIKIKKKYGITRDFLLYVGVLDHHKNIDGLIKAFSMVKLKETGLVLAGLKNDPRDFMFINRLIDKLGLKERVYITGYIPQDDLIGLYNMAKAVISVSLYEGFGLPILEAMSCGTPVIASKNTSMGEIVGSAGILVDPYNIEEITDAMDKLLSDEGLRNILAKKALDRSREFSWKRAAEETLSVYKGLSK